MLYIYVCAGYNIYAARKAHNTNNTNNTYAINAPMNGRLAKWNTAN